jgi:hypothetical protein
MPNSILPSATRLDPVVPPFLGHMFFRPWWDALGVPLVTGLYFPLSRAWATASACEGDYRRFAEELGLPPASAVLANRVRAVSHLARLYERAEASWRQAFFTSDGSSAELALAAARRRDRISLRYMMARRMFLPWLRRLPSVRWNIVGVDKVWARHGARIRGPEPGYPAPAFPEIATSASLPLRSGRQYWLRYRSPVLADEAWAHVYEAPSAKPATTMIFLHGIAVDGDMWPEAGDTFGALLERDIRIVRPVGPWHGRRMLKGYYGGEPIISRGLGGMLEAFQAWLAEIAILIRWARERGSRTVVLAGASLGSLAAQLGATACRNWPLDMRPDVLFLVATSGSLIDVAFEGSLSKALRIPRRLEDAGWTAEAIAPWLPLLEPHGPSAVAPERIVMVLGKADNLTPYAGGNALARRWAVPHANVFLRPQGHFSVALGLLCDPLPVERLLAIISDVQGRS